MSEQMAGIWMRTRTMYGQGQVADEEWWIRGKQRFRVGVTSGKKTNLLKLKKNSSDQLHAKIAETRKSRVELYSEGELDDVDTCMVCGAPASEAVPALVVYHAQYSQCTRCSHVYVIRRPSQATISRFYQSDTAYAATYTDKSAAERRLQTIAEPWVDWLADSFESVHGRPIRSVVDVGAGGGHFVEACRRRGLEAHGIELSEASREFAKQVWGIEEDPRDFLQVALEYQGADAVTFWGLLEHVADPGSFLAAAHNIVASSDAGMVAAKLPRWESLSSAAQSICPDTVLRHLDPRGHIMCFTDASAAELYFQNDFQPSNAWYYGMDAYELLMQIANRSGCFDAFLETGEEQVEIQQWIDEARFSDGIVLAGIPA